VACLAVLFDCCESRECLCVVCLGIGEWLFFLGSESKWIYVSMDIIYEYIYYIIL
jgi:hypothetical protein